MDHSDFLGGSARPERLPEFRGQSAVKERLGVYLSAAKGRGEALDHILLSGPPGLGKTTLAGIVAAEMEGELHKTSGPGIEKPKDLAGLLTKLTNRDVLFIDEIHRLSPRVEEALYPAMEDFRFDIVLDEGPKARSISLPLQRFTLVGATTLVGNISKPLHSRFGIHIKFDFYPAEELQDILRQQALRLGIPCEEDALYEIARRSRGTPRRALLMLARVRDYAESLGTGRVEVDITREALRREGVDEFGLDATDAGILRVIIERFNGGPVGLDTIAAMIGEDPRTIAEVHEPFLIQHGFIERTPRGRVASLRAFEHLDITPPAGFQGMLL